MTSLCGFRESGKSGEAAKGAPAAALPQAAKAGREFVDQENSTCMFPDSPPNGCRQEFTQNIFLGPSRESAISQGTPKERRGAIPRDLKPNEVGH
jgi:hypothetical protein